MKYLADEIEKSEFPVPTYSKIEITGNVIAGILFVIQWVFFSIRFSTMENSVPVQFSLDGEPEQYATKTTLLVFPATLTLVCVILTALERFPDRFKYSIRIDAYTAPIVFSYARKFLIYIKVVTCALFMFLISMMVNVVEQQAKPKDMYYSFLFVPLYFAGIFAYFQVMKKLRVKIKRPRI